MVTLGRDLIFFSFMPIKRIKKDSMLFILRKRCQIKRASPIHLGMDSKEAQTSVPFGKVPAFRFSIMKEVVSQEVNTLTLIGQWPRRMSWKREKVYWIAIR